MKGKISGVIQGSEMDWPRTGRQQVTAPLTLFERTTEKRLQLEKSCDNSTPFFIACQEGHLTIVRALYDEGVDIETPDEAGATPFYSACLFGHIDVVRFLYRKTNKATNETLDPERGVHGPMGNHDGQKPLDAARQVWHAPAPAPAPALIRAEALRMACISYRGGYAAVAAPPRRQLFERTISGVHALCSERHAPACRTRAGPSLPLAGRH